MFVPRPHLSDRLKREQRRLSLLCAPAGFGKTVLLRDYVQAAPPGRVVWLSLGGQPQTLEGIAARVAAELGVAADLGADALLRVLDAGQVSSARTPSRAGSLPPLTAFPRGSEPAREGGLISPASLSAGPLHLVFDDLPAQLPADLNHWFDRLLALDAPHLHLLVSCRQRPDWNLPRLLLMGQLLELDARHLALRPDEFQAWVQRLAPHTDGPARQRLWHDTAGWCAGVRLLLPTTEGATPLLAQYLERELLARLSDEQREVLYGLAHLSKVSVELCEQLWEGQAGGQRFQQLLGCQAFIFAVENQPQWFSLLPAVAQALQGHLSGARLNRLRLRACQRLSVLGHVEDAVEQALRADQPEVAANYMEGLWLRRLLCQRHLDQMMIWRERIDPQLLQSSPRLIYLCAKALLCSGRLDEAQQCLGQLRHFLPLPDPRRHQRLLANWQALHGAVHALRGNSELAWRHCQAAREHLAPEDWLSQLLCQCLLARSAMDSGKLDQARAFLGQSLETARRHGSRDAEVLINIDRARLMVLEGQPGLAQSLLQREVERLRASRALPCPLLGRVLFQLGDVQLSRGLGREAEQTVQAGLVQVGDCCAPYVLPAFLLLSEMSARGDDVEQAQLYLYEAERRMQWGKVDRACYEQAVEHQRTRNLDRERREDAPPAMPRDSVKPLAVVPDYQDGLTPREVSVLKLLAEGMSVREVGSRLFISVNTVKTHAKNINVKLGAVRRTQAINCAKVMGILA